MGMLCKSGALHSLDIMIVHQGDEDLIVSSPLDKMLFNTILITIMYYFIYLELGLCKYSDLDKLVILKLEFDRTSLQVWRFANTLWYALINLESLKYVCPKYLFLPFGKCYLFFYYHQKIPTLNWTRPWEILPMRLLIFFLPE